MAVAEYITKDELDALEKRLTKAMSAMADRLREDMATKADVRADGDRVIEAIQRGTSANF